MTESRVQQSAEHAILMGPPRMLVRETRVTGEVPPPPRFGKIGQFESMGPLAGIWFLIPLLIHLAIQVAHGYLDRAPDFDEAIYMDLARSIVRTGTVLTSNYPPRPFLIHPPLFYYLVSLSFALLGPGLEAGRLVSTLMAVGNLGFVFAFLRRGRGARWAAAGTLLIAVNPAFLYYGHSVYMEMTVAFWMTAALWAFSRINAAEGLRWERWTGVFLGLACLTKYYAGILVGVMAMVIILEWSRSWASRIRSLAALLGPVAIAGVVWVAWGLTMGARYFIEAQLSWSEPDMSGSIYSWRHVSNGLFLRELVGVLTPAFAFLAAVGLAIAVWRVWRSRSAQRASAEWVFVIFPIAYVLFLMTFREKDVKYIVPLIPLLGILIGLAPTVTWANHRPAWLRWTGTLLLAALSSPLLPLYDPVTGQRHDNLWVFGIRRDAEYRLYRDAGILAGQGSSPGQVVACQRKGPIIGYFADRPYLESWGFTPEKSRPYIQAAEIVVLDRNTEYLSPQEQAVIRQFVELDFRRINALPGPENPILEVFQRIKREPPSP
jgi:dolichyl-phosphate-mannose-protein mannosyltransferase